MVKESANPKPPQHFKPESRPCGVNKETDASASSQLPKLLPAWSRRGRGPTFCRRGAKFQPPATLQTLEAGAKESY